MISEETALAVLAGAYAISNSARFRGATFMWDIHGNQGGPKEISFHKAADKLRALGDMAMKGRTNKHTNADRIRALSDEELAKTMCDVTCPENMRDKPCDETRCQECWLEYLKQPAEEI